MLVQSLVVSFTRPAFPRRRPPPRDAAAASEE